MNKFSAVFVKWVSMYSVKRSTIISFEKNFSLFLIFVTMIFSAVFMFLHEQSVVCASELKKVSADSNNKFKNRKKLHTVFFDDFNGNVLSNKWKKITNTIPNRNNPEELQKERMKHHRSIYITDDDTCYVNNGCLVLKCIKYTNQYLGVYDDEIFDPNIGKIRNRRDRDYKSGYVSTQDSFAIPKGRISAKIKLNRPITSGFAFTFFTFGQNNYWPKAPEFDIVEGTLELLSKDRASKSGIIYPAGSMLSMIASHTHFLTDKNLEGVINGYHKIVVDDKVVFRKNNIFDETDWHEYAVEWDEVHVSYYVDETLVNCIDLTALKHNTVFNSPADVRINIKARPWVEEKEAALFVDWVKVESDNLNRIPTEISQKDITLSVGQTYYVSPFFSPVDATNYAFNMTSKSNHIRIMNLLPEYEAVYHQIKAVSAGEAVVNLTTADGKHHGQFMVTVTD